MHALCLFELLPEGFRNADLRSKVAELLNQEPGTYSQGRMTYDLRRLRLHGLIERQPHSNRYHITQDGARIILFFTRAEARFFSIVLAIEHPMEARQAPRVLVQASQAIDRLIQEAKLAA
jgi:DNA-binding PadR family transcriptional regulator